MNRLLLASAQQQLGMGRSGDRCCLVVMTASPLFDFPQQKEEREREWREHEHKLPVFLCRPSLFSLSLLFFIFLPSVVDSADQVSTKSA